jgi:hypothetical protein
MLSSGCFLGEQVLEVFGIHVEPSVLGDGSCCYHGNCACEWRSEYSAFLVLCCYVFENSWVALHVKFLQGKPPDWQDFVGIIVLLFINSTISFIEENNAGNAAAALMARLAPKAKVSGFGNLFFCCKLVIFKLGLRGWSYLGVVYLRVIVIWGVIILFLFG